jgi:hypothetical protein
VGSLVKATAAQVFAMLTRREKLAIAANDERTRTNVFGYQRDLYDADVISATVELCNRYAYRKG